MTPLGPSDPRQIGPYRVVGELGRGGMGRVLLAAGRDGRLVALKLVHAQHVEDPGFRERFRREVNASRRVSGAYTAAVVDADAEAEQPWLATVFVPGPSLRQAVDAAGPLPGPAVLRLAAGLATALGEIHAAGLVHRDLKPSNVLLAADGPRVIDFGVARATDGGTSELTHTGRLVGSPGYMSPEQAESKTLTPASDVFSLGAVLYLAATGVDPFMGNSTHQPAGIQPRQPVQPRSARRRWHRQRALRQRLGRGTPHVRERRRRQGGLHIPGRRLEGRRPRVRRLPRHDHRRPGEGPRRCRL